MSQKILIITYYWPPSGGSGVQRWLKFVKYLPQFGWTPYVCTPENPAFELRDESLLKDVPDEAEVLKLPIWEPYKVYARLIQIFTGRKVKSTDYISIGNKSFLQTFATFIRGNFFIPDPKIFWRRSAVKFLHDFIQHNHIRIIITTGPPHSLHLIGLSLKKKNPLIKWLADFRDPWSKWDLLDTLHLTHLARARHRYLEHQVLTQADYVVTVSSQYVNWFRMHGARKIKLITNGYDEDDFVGLHYVKGSRFTVRHIGVVDELRDPRPFMLAVREVCSENIELATMLTIEFVGPVNSFFRSWVQADEQLNKITTFREYLPHDQILGLYNSSDVLLLVLVSSSVAVGHIPGKLFEYLGSKRPIIGIGPPDGDSAAILKKTGAGVIIDPSNLQDMKHQLLELFSNWIEGKPHVTKGITSYSRRSLTAELDALLNSL